MAGMDLIIFIVCRVTDAEVWVTLTGWEKSDATETAIEDLSTGRQSAGISSVIVA
jgi:hypothetical protein